MAAVLAQKATLMHHVFVVVSTPFCFFLAATWLARIDTLIIFVGVGLLWATGLIVIDLPAWESIRREVVIFSGIAIALWVLGGFLTVVDHFRFHGWAEGGPPEADAFVGAYCDAVFDRHDVAAIEMCAPSNSDNISSFNARMEKLRSEINDGCVIASPEQLGTSEYTLFRALVQHLQTIKAAPSDVVAFIPIVSDSDEPVRSPLRLILLLVRPASGKFEVAEARLVKIARPSVS